MIPDSMIHSFNIYVMVGCISLSQEIYSQVSVKWDGSEVVRMVDARTE
jgi:hypothetical protein